MNAVQMLERAPTQMRTAWTAFAAFAIAVCGPASLLSAQDPAPAAEAGGEADLPPDRDNGNLVRKTYAVWPFLRCPHGVLQWQPGWPQPIIVPDAAPDDRFIGDATPVGNLIQFLLVGHFREPGVNHFASRAGELTVTNTPAAQKDVQRIFDALAAMPAMNLERNALQALPGIQKIHVGKERCVKICSTTPTDGGENLESVLYDVSDLVANVTIPQLDTLIKAIDRQSWSDAGGPGALSYYEPARAIAVVQTAGNHAKIQRAMAEWRGLKPAPVKRPKPPAKPATAVGASQLSAVQS